MTKSTYDILRIVGIFFLVLLIVAMIGIGPVISIWSLNTLFNLAIAFNLYTWLAMVWVQLVTFGGVIGKLSQISKKL